MTTALELHAIHKRFGDFVALKSIDLSIESGELVCFLGPSGCGKTTLLRIIAGLERQTSGTVIQNGRDVSTAPPAARDYGIVFQSYALFPNLTIEDNVAYGLVNRRKGKSEIKTRVAELLDLARLPPPTLAEHRALSDLSVRVAAAMKPEVAPVRAGSGLRSARRLAAGILVASGIAAVAIVPLVVRRQRPPPAATEEVETASAPASAPAAEGKPGESGWQEPDLDTLWQDAAVVSLVSEDG